MSQESEELLKRLKALDFKEVDNENLRANASQVRDKIAQYKEDIEIMDRVSDDTLLRRFTI